MRKMCKTNFGDEMVASSKHEVYTYARNQKENKAVDKTASKASKVMQKVLTNYGLSRSFDYINVNNDEKIKKGLNRMAELNRLIHNDNMCDSQEYLNSVNQSNQKDAMDIASMVMSIFAGLIYSDEINYINLSTDNNVKAENGAVASMVMHQSNKLGLRGLSGSNPDRTVSAHSLENVVIPPTTVWSGNSNDYSQNTFDLLVTGRDVEFDHIIDPHSILTMGSPTTLCGEVTAYDTIFVNASGILTICPFNGTKGTGYVNISLGLNGNFTLVSGGLVLGNGSGGEGGAGTTSQASVPATQGDDGNSSTVGGGGGK